jgi:glutamine amidotransferase
MCRLLGYLGPTLRLGHLVESAPHSLERQSYAPREMRGAIVNADGWGAGWYLAGDGREPNVGQLAPERVASGRAVPDDEPCVYRSTLPIWADVNRSELGRAVRSHCIVAAVRSATDPLSVAAANTQPFRFQRLLFVHNGFIEGLDGRLRRELLGTLSDTAYGLIRGNTDSELVFARLVDAWLAGRTNERRLAVATASTVQLLSSLCDGAHRRALFTLLVSDGHELVAVRAASNDQAPSLYVRKNHAAWIASEPLDDEPGWEPIPERSLVVAQADAPHRIEALA